MVRRAVLFDIGNVVRRFDNTRGIRQLMALGGLYVRHGCLQVFEDEVWKGYGEGKVTDRQFRRHIRERFNLYGTDEQIDTAVSDVFTPIPETVAMIDLLRQREDVTLVAVSNVEPVRLRSKQTANVWKMFDHVVASCELGFMKPDPRMFQVALQKAEVSAQDALFVDDLKENVDAAERLGIRSHCFDLKQPKKLETFLGAHGLQIR